MYLNHLLHLCFSDSPYVLGPFENEYLLHLKCKSTFSDLSERCSYTFFFYSGTFCF